MESKRIIIIIIIIVTKKNPKLINTKNRLMVARGGVEGGQNGQRGSKGTNFQL